MFFCPSVCQRAVLVAQCFQNYFFKLIFNILQQSRYIVAAVVVVVVVDFICCNIWICRCCVDLSLLWSWKCSCCCRYVCHLMLFAIQVSEYVYKNMNFGYELHSLEFSTSQELLYILRLLIQFITVHMEFKSHSEWLVWLVGTIDFLLSTGIKGISEYVCLCIDLILI